jgi:hypothetical protein
LAAKAIIHLLTGADGEARRSFLMEGAESLVIFSLFFQYHIRRYDLVDIGLSFDFFDSIGMKRRDFHSGGVRSFIILAKDEIKCSKPLTSELCDQTYITNVLLLLVIDNINFNMAFGDRSNSAI